MLNVYCIPGMGVDERLYSNLKLDNCFIHHIKWETPFANESLPDYALRLSGRINPSEPFVLIGVSFGGMCCAEIAKQLNPVKTFIISSCKNNSELPNIVKLFRFVPIYKLIGDKLFILLALIIKKRFGVKGKEQTVLFKKVLNTVPVNYFSGAVECIINWKTAQSSVSIIYIHGTADKILPYKKIKNCDYTIKNGSHWMVMDKAEEINAILNKELAYLLK